MKRRPARPVLREKVREIVIEHTGHRPERVRLESRLVQDLGIDSLDLIELVLSIEEALDITIPEPAESGDPIFESVFTKPDFSVGDLAELVYLQWDSEGRRPGVNRWKGKITKATRSLSPFSQWDGVWVPNAGDPLFKALGANESGHRCYRRLSDGMGCVTIPAATVAFGQRKEEMAAFLIDVEPVSTTAYARFLNSVGPIDSELELLWFSLPSWDKRGIHLPLIRDDGRWIPQAGTETWPMILVSWFGANAYAFWANGDDWRDFEGSSPYLPSGRQFEYAARGTEPRLFPWGADEATPERVSVDRLEFRRRYKLEELPLSPVNERLGVSPFGLRHMAGNVWQWCRDWHDPETKKVRVERGGSWVGPAELARCDYSRGRPPFAKGRCLGFRCVSALPDSS